MRVALIQQFKELRNTHHSHKSKERLITAVETFEQSEKQQNLKRKTTVDDLSNNRFKRQIDLSDKLFQKKQLLMI